MEHLVRQQRAQVGGFGGVVEGKGEAVLQADAAARVALVGPAEHAEAGRGIAEERAIMAVQVAGPCHQRRHREGRNALPCGEEAVVRGRKHAGLAAHVVHVRQFRSGHRLARRRVADPEAGDALAVRAVGGEVPRHTGTARRLVIGQDQEGVARRREAAQFGAHLVLRQGKRRRGGVDRHAVMHLQRALDGTRRAPQAGAVGAVLLDVLDTRGKRAAPVADGEAGDRSAAGDHGVGDERQAQQRCTLGAGHAVCHHCHVNIGHVLLGVGLCWRERDAQRRLGGGPGGRRTGQRGQQG